MFDIFSSFPASLILFLSAVLFIAGCVRGFAGFGAGMIFMPIATSLISPATAAASFLFIDGIVTLPMLVRALRICDWKTILPAVGGAVLSVHFGAWLLANAETSALRWGIFFLVSGLLILLVSGWRYKKRPTPPVSYGVGITAGVLGGISQVSGPPVVAFWLSSSSEPATVRANLIVFFALASLGTFVAYIWNGFFTIAVWHLLIAAIPSYAVGLFVGSRSFKSADPKHYRWVAYLLIGLAAITSMPLLDTYLR